jgi:glycine/sarcosine N-methyltransferase
MNSVISFYDTLAEDYHLIFADWNASIARQAGVLDRIIRSRMGDGPISLLDCACGIGTQAIALGGLDGYTVTASDISPQSVERLKRESAQRNLDIRLQVADMRMLVQQVDGVHSMS